MRNEDEAIAKNEAFRRQSVQEMLEKAPVNEESITTNVLVSILKDVLVLLGFIIPLWILVKLVKFLWYL
jgi:F0F1-type ATP synthase membrane subunit c/vacuolar-type H+-ATPase subunit K